MDTDDIDSIGVSICQETFSRMGMIFREQKGQDYGIDAIVEPKTDVYASGQLIGLQIKSGDSYLKESSEKAFVFRGEMKHYHYWLNHCLPVLIILVDINTRTCYWQRVEKHLITLTEKSWKIEIPKINILFRPTQTQHMTIHTLIRKPLISIIMNLCGEGAMQRL